jgi:hypothetical protein
LSQPALCAATSRRDAAPARPRRLRVCARARPDAPPPEVACRPRPTCLPHVDSAPETPRLSPCHAPPRRRTVRAPCTRRTTGPTAVRPYACRPRSAVARRHLGRRHPAATVVEPAPSLRRQCLPAGKHRAGRPPLPPSHQDRPSTSISSRPTTSHPSLGCAKARALAHYPAKSPPRHQLEPPRPSPPPRALAGDPSAPTAATTGS